MGKVLPLAGLPGRLTGAAPRPRRPKEQLEGGPESVWRGREPFQIQKIKKVPGISRKSGERSLTSFGTPSFLRDVCRRSQVRIVGQGPLRGESILMVSRRLVKMKEFACRNRVKAPVRQQLRRPRPTEN